MKRILRLFAILFFGFQLHAQVHVRGYTRKDGTHVQPHMRSVPDHNPYNNWSTKGNVNPYTGAVGTRSITPRYSGSTPSSSASVGSAGGGYSAPVNGSGAVSQSAAPVSPDLGTSERVKRPITVADLPKSTFSGDSYNDRDALLTYQKEQAAKGNAQSQFVMANRYLTGTGVEKDEAKARELLEAASKSGNLKAREKLRELDQVKKTPSDQETK
jgi:hypothetical protein